MRCQSRRKKTHSIVSRALCSVRRVGWKQATLAIYAQMSRLANEDSLSDHREIQPIAIGGQSHLRLNQLRIPQILRRGYIDDFSTISIAGEDKTR